VVECVGIPETFDLCQKLLGLGGVLTNVGVHGTKADLHLQDLWAKNICKSLHNSNWLIRLTGCRHHQPAGGHDHSGGPGEPGPEGED
jgi:threonine dehydrogenase-like Zn-dependent dehydrogenase